MKDLISIITESRKEICPEVQNEFENDYAYQSYTTTKSKFDYGFLTFDANQEFYSVVGVNENSEFIDSLCNDFNLDAEELLDLKVGESISDKSHGDNYNYSILRIW